MAAGTKLINIFIFTEYTSLLLNIVAYFEYCDALLPEPSTRYAEPRVNVVPSLAVVATNG